MISNAALQKLATHYQTGLFPNIVREYLQHIFLSEFYKLPGAENLLFKGGTALRVVYGSPRFSEDLDFTAINIESWAIKDFVEDIFVGVLKEIERSGIKVEIGAKSGATSGGYFGIANFRMTDYQPVNVGINISSRNTRDMLRGEVDSIANDFVPTYTLQHLPQDELVDEKIFGAMMARKKPRDFYDLYFIMRKGMLAAGHKKHLKEVKDEVLAAAKAIDFRGELGAFLPASQQIIIRDFQRALTDELNRQLS